MSNAWREGFLEGLRPEQPLTVSEWADRYRKLSSKASAEPGPWRTDRTPYLREPMDCLSTESAVQRVVMMFAAQTGKTEAGSNWLGYVIDHAPGPMLCVQPTIEMAKRLSKQRLESMITETPVLSAKIAPARSRDSGNTMFSKEFSGGIMLMAGANSATGLRSAPCRYLFCDEVDAFPADVDGEGDPVSLAERRTTTFARRKILLTSTPTVKDFSRIEAEYERSDQRRFYVPCPSCGAMEWLKWGQLKWTDGRPKRAVSVRALRRALRGAAQAGHVARR
jgi:phage terminase large subunit GpA-like protein